MASSLAGEVADAGVFCNALKQACFASGQKEKVHGGNMANKQYAGEIVEKGGQFCVGEGDDEKCYPTREAAEKAVEEMSKRGGPNMDEKKYAEEKKRLEDERKAAEDKAKKFEQELAALKAANEEAKGKESEALAKVKKLERERHDDQTRAWIAEQKRAGKILPVEEPRVAAIFAALYEDQRTVTFAQADGKEAKESLADALKAFVSSRAAKIYGELSVHEDEPEGADGDPGAEVDRKTKEHMVKAGVKDYAEAMKAVLAVPENRELAERYRRLQN